MSTLLRALAVATIAFGAASLAAFACDPVQNDAVDALGDEVPGVRPGPLHRPGQPCLVCHDGTLGNPNEFSVAGTIFQNAFARTAAAGATVTLTGADGKTFEAYTNEAGNFYIQPREWTPAYPMKAAVTYQGITVKMTAVIGRDGSCGKCHTDPVGPGSPSHIYIPPDGGTY
jgi:hypothetical protein